MARCCVMLEIETSDPRVHDNAVATVGGTSKVRRAILEHLPHRVTRVIAVFPTEHAKMLMQLHEAVGEHIAEQLRETGVNPDAEAPFVRPPPGYVPPTQE